MSQQMMQRRSQEVPQRLAQPYGYPTSEPAGNLMDLIDRILDKGLVIDLYVKINLVGIELLEIQARVVIAGVETYLRYAREMQMMGLAAKPRVGNAGMRQQQMTQQHLQQQSQRRGTMIPVSGPQRRQQQQQQMRPMMTQSQRRAGR